MFLFDSLALTSVGVYLLLALITILSAPRAELANQQRRLAAGLVIGGTALAYCSSSPWIFLLGWALSAAPLWLEREVYGMSVRAIHLASTACLALGFLLEAQSLAGFALLALATALRKGIFPVNFWVTSAFEKGSVSYLSLFLNGHLGAYLMIRYAMPDNPEGAVQALPILSALAIFTSVYGALLGLAAGRPRRILALLCTSQAAFILAGLENRNVEGVTGALVHWWVVAFATTALLAVYRVLEARTTEAESPSGFLGLGFHAPRLAVFFLVAALALVGLPGTLGFAAEDLLFHGSLESHPLLGIGLPLATALNAITALRLTATLFMGRRGLHVPPIPDASLRERLAFSLPIIVLVASGISPAFLVSLRSPIAASIAGFLGHR